MNPSSPSVIPPIIPGDDPSGIREPRPYPTNHRGNHRNQGNHGGFAPTQIGEFIKVKWIRKFTLKIYAALEIDPLFGIVFMANHL